MSTTKSSKIFEVPAYPSCFSHITAESSITGAKFIGDTKVSEKARFFWIGTFILSMFGCIIHGIQIYDKWNVTPDIGVKTLYEPSVTIPYPAITICHQSKVTKK
jgi:amiloride-sensitive sodium channel